MTTIDPTRYRQGQAPAVTESGSAADQVRDDDRYRWCLTPEVTVEEQVVVVAVATVNDPEYPDVSIVDLGLLESVHVDGGVARVSLVPTFSGCPALRMIGDDVTAAVEALDDIDRCVVTWLTGEVWTTDRMSDSARARLAAEYTVVVRAADGSTRCPVCGGTDVVDQSMAGPTRCRSVAWCADCRNPVEVMRMDPEPVPAGGHADPDAVPVTVAPLARPVSVRTRTTHSRTGRHDQSHRTSNEGTH